MQPCRKSLILRDPLIFSSSFGRVSFSPWLNLTAPFRGDQFPRHRDKRRDESWKAGVQRPAHLPKEQHDKAVLLLIQDEPPRCHEANAGYQRNRLCGNKSMHENVKKEMSFSLHESSNCCWSSESNHNNTKNQNVWGYWCNISKDKFFHHMFIIVFLKVI